MTDGGDVREQVVKEVLGEVFGVKPSRIDSGFSMEDVKDWDSVAHLNLVLVLEERLGITFLPDDIGRMTDVTGILAVVQVHEE